MGSHRGTQRRPHRKPLSSNELAPALPCDCLVSDRGGANTHCRTPETPSGPFFKQEKKGLIQLTASTYAIDEINPEDFILSQAVQIRQATRKRRDGLDPER